MPTKELTFERVRQLFDYAPLTGQLIWLPRAESEFARPQDFRVWHKRFCLKPAGGPTGDGRLSVGIDGALYAVSRVVWLWHTARWPREMLDHIDGDVTNNRLSNLRDVPHKINMRNRALGSNNNSGVFGVHWYPRDSKWYAEIGVDGASIHLGVFDDWSDAVIVRQAAERKYGFHANHGRSRN